MSEFIAKIKAVLDTSKAEQQLKELENKQIKIGVEVDGQKEIPKVNQEIVKAKKSSDSFGDALKKALNIGSAASIVYNGIRLIRNAMKDAIEAVKEYDAAVTELRMATNGNYDDTLNLVKTYNSMGQNLGATTKEVSESANAWLRQGKTISETNTLIRDSMILSKVGNIKAADATEYLTSSIKGFKISANDALSVVDKLAAVDLSAAVDAGGLAEGMSRVAVTANMAGVSMDRLLGYLATVGEVTQKSMSSVGESFKIIFTRMNDIKGKKLELIDEDGTTETLNDVEMTLKNVGIDLRATVNEYNNFGDVLDNLASKWGSLSRVQQNALAKAFAGTRQAENFRVLMENYDSARKYMDVAANSAGTAEKKFGAYLESIEAKTKSLQAAFESLANNNLSTGFVGGVIDASTAIVKILDNANLLKGTIAGITVVGLIKGFTLLATGVSNAAIRFNDFNSALQLVKAGNIGEDQISQLARMTANLSDSQTKAVLSSKALSTEQRIGILMSQGMSQAEAQAALSAMGLSTAEGAATASTFSFTGALKGLWATLMSNPLVLVATGIAAAVSIFTTLKQNAEEARQAAIDAGNTAKDEANSILDLYSSYQKASLAYKSNTGSKEDLESATDSLLSALGVEKDKVQELTEKYGDLDTAMNSVTKKALQEKASKLLSGYDSAKEEALSTAQGGFWGKLIGKSSNILVSNSGDDKKFAEPLLKAGIIQDIPMLQPVIEGINDKSSYEDLVKSYNRLIKARKALEAEVGNLYTAEELSESKVYRDISSQINEIEPKIKTANEQAKAFNEVQAQLAYMDYAESNGVPKSRQQYEELKKSLIDSAKASGKFVGSQKQIESAINSTLSKMPELSAYAGNYIDSLDSVQDATKATVDDIKSGVSAITKQTSNLVGEIAGVQNILKAQSTGVSLSVEDYNSDALRDYGDALEYVNGSMQLNVDKVNEIIKAKTKEQLEINNANKALAQSKYLENAAQIEKLRQKIKDKTFAEGESADTVQATIDALLDENKTIKTNCDQYDLITSSLQDATSAYQHWINAQKASQSGDMFDDTLDAINRINDTLSNKDSEYYGRVGRTDYKAAVDLIVPESVDSENEAKVKAYLKSIKDLFTYDDDGNRAGLNIENFCKKAVSKGLMVLDKFSGEYKIAGQKTMQDFADGLNLSLPLVQAMFGEMEEYGGHFDWTDEAVKTIGDLGVSANEAAEKLRGLAGNEDLSIKLDVSDIDSTEDKIAALETTISEMQEYKGKADVDASQIEYANQIIEYCVAQEQNLSEPIVMAVNTSALDEKTADAINKIQEFKRACNDLEIKQKLGVDTTEAEKQVNDLAGQVKGIDSNILASLSLDTSSVDTLKASVNAITGEQLNVKLGIDESAIIGWQADSKSATVKYSVDSSEVDAYKQQSEDKTATVTFHKVSTEVDQYNPLNLSRTVTYHVKTEGSVSANGTAHFEGTAKAGGDWGTATGGTTLVGELGTEIVCIPSTGKWYTVGEDGAEFRDIPTGAIVFNHKQTESLLKYGHVPSRASALVGGTALASGTAMVTGGIKVSSAKASTTTKRKTKTKSKTKNKTKSKSKSKSSSKSTDLDTVDWIEIAISRLEKAVDAFELTANNTYETLQARLKATSGEISTITKEISVQEQAYKRYIKQADSVGLSSALKKKVQDGTIDISKYDEKTQKFISDYKKWYENALNCAAATKQLKKELSALYEDKFETIQRDFNNQLDLLKDTSDRYMSQVDLRHAKGYFDDVSYYEKLREIEGKNVTILKSEYSSLKKQFDEAMKSGKIKEGSESWYKMKLAINDVEKAIADSNVKAVEFSNTIRDIKWGYFDYVQDRISQITQEGNFLLDLMDEFDLFDEKGKFTNYGMSALGLRTQDYSVYLEQAKKYADEIKSLDKEIANDPYNKDLIKRREELLKLQQGSIKSAQQERKAIVDLVKDGIEKELSSLKDLIDAYTDELDSAKDLYDYQNRIADKTSNIASLNKQLSAYANDNSEEVKAKVQKLKVEIDKANKDLQETQYEHSISEQKKLLSSLYDDYETTLNSRLDDVDSLITEMIGAVDNNAGVINDTLKEIADRVGYSITDNSSDIWSGKDGVKSAVGDVVGDIQSGVNQMIYQSGTASQKPTASTQTNTTTTTTPMATTSSNTTTAKQTDSAKQQSKTISVGGKINAKGAKIYAYAGARPETQLFSRDPVYDVLQIKNGWVQVRYHKLNKGVTGWFKQSDIKAYKTGGLIDYTGLAQVDGTKTKPEMVLNANDTKNFLAIVDKLKGVPLSIKGDEFAGYKSIIQHAISSADTISKKLNSIQSRTVNQDVNSNVTLNVNIDHVENYDEFVEKLKHDGQFEKFVQAVTTDRLVGGSALAKYKYM